MRLPWTIWRHVFAETWRLLLLTTTVLAVVTAFGITVRYTAAGKLSPLDTIKFMGVAIVPMLQYVLPFAAGFGATLAYHRMTHENELTAAKAGGISHRALLVPALVTGLIVAAGLSELNGNVIPRFLRSMESMVYQDAAKMVFRTIESGQALRMGNREIYADKVYQVESETTGPSAPTDILMLSRVLALEFGPGNRIVREATAGAATLAFFAGDSDSALTVYLRMQKPQVFQEGVRSSAGEFSVAFPFPSRFNDNPRYNTNRELAEMPANPDRVNFIDAHRRTLAHRLAEHDLVAAIGASLRSQGQVRLIDREGRTFSIRASGLKWSESRWELSPALPGKPIEVELYKARKGVPNPSDRDQLTAVRAALVSDAGAEPSARTLTVSLHMEGLTVRIPGSGVINEKPEQVYPGLATTEDPLAPLILQTSYELLAEAARRTPAQRDAKTDAAARDLQTRLDRLLRESVSHRHERAALAGACLVMVLIGAMTAMRMGDSLPLTVYLWSFFPALLSVVSVATGQTIAYQIGMWGLYVLWAGLGVLSIYGFWAFWVVRRH